MSSQNESSMTQNGNVSELEMVGALLFGSISDASTEFSASSSASASVSAVPEAGRMVNLGARIAPEPSRQWEEAKPEVVLSSSDASMISGILPEKKNPSPVRTAESPKVEREAEEMVSAVTAPLPLKSRQPRILSLVYGTCLTLLACCTAIMGWQLYSAKDSAETPALTKVAEAEAARPMAEAISAPSVDAIPENAFAPMESEPTFAETQPVEGISARNATVADAIPQYQPNASAGMEEVPTYQAVGGAVAMEESYPTFNADLATTVPAQAPSANAVSAPVYAQNQYAAPAVQTSGNWDAGSTMEEIPVFNSEISSFPQAQPAPAYAQNSLNAIPASTSHAPQVAPMAPQVGTQAQVPAPRKLARPTHAEPVSAPAAEEEYPSFNPGLGVDSALPVSYY